MSTIVTTLSGSPGANESAAAYRQRRLNYWISEKEEAERQLTGNLPVGVFQLRELPDRIALCERQIAYYVRRILGVGL